MPNDNVKIITSHLLDESPEKRLLYASLIHKVFKDIQFIY